METRTIAPDDWKSMFDSFSRVYDGSTATLEILSADLGAQMEIEEQPLRGISYDKPSGIEVHFLTRNGSHLVHRIPRPLAVAFEEGADGLVAAIEIESTDDPERVVRLHAPLASKLLTEGKA